jgi:hypothetical protein
MAGMCSSIAQRRPTRALPSRVLRRAPLVHRRASLALLLALALASTGCDIARYAGLPSLFRRAPRPAPDSTALHGGAVLVGAGDIGFCGLLGDLATAALLDRIPGTVFTAGDNAYPEANAQYLEKCYGSTWGRHKARTHPAMGNHEYEHGEAEPDYFTYFGDRAGPPGRGYYSYELGAWHVVVMNSNIDASVGSPQERWLRDDLATHRTGCTIAYWHHPLFSSSSGATPTMRPLWDALYESGAELVVNGHHHAYERFAPQRPDGTLDTRRGIREIVAGTGGAGLDKFGRTRPHSEKRWRKDYGVLKLELYPGRYRWQFVSVDGRVRDRGEGRCH